MKLRLFFFIVFIWLGIGVLHVFFTYLDRVKAGRFEASGFPLEILYYLSAYVSWSFICFLILKLSKCYIRAEQYKHLVILFFLGLILWLPLFFIIDMNIGSILGITPVMTPLEILSQITNQIIFFYTLLYTSMFGCCVAISLYDYSKSVVIEKLELEKQEALHRSHLSDLQMKALQSQLSPHFLFNSLGSISGLARQSNKEAVISAIARLGDMLRFTVENSQKRCIPLATELAFVDNYITLQKLRFSNRFVFNITNNTHSENIVCPPFSLQLLIENAFIHGVNKSNERTYIEVTLEEHNNQLTFIVCNTKANEYQQSTSLKSGLANLNDRLKMIYGDSASIQLFPNEVSKKNESNTKGSDKDDFKAHHVKIHYFKIHYFKIKVSMPLEDVDV